MSYIEGRFVYGDDVYVDECYFDEVWAHISGFPGYLVSNKGRVWSKKKNGFIKVKPMDDHGHLGVCLSHNGVSCYMYIHRLVAEAFLPNPDNFPIVRHLYDDPSQNTDSDLAWGTQKDNMQDAIRNGTAYSLTAEDRYKGNRDRMTSLVAIDISTGKSLWFESQSEASRVLGIPQANIWQVLHGRRYSAGGYTFKEGSYE